MLLHLARDSPRSTALPFALVCRYHLVVVLPRLRIASCSHLQLTGQRPDGSAVDWRADSVRRYMVLLPEMQSYRIRYTTQEIEMLKQRPDAKETIIHVITAVADLQVLARFCYRYASAEVEPQTPSPPSLHLHPRTSFSKSAIRQTQTHVTSCPRHVGMRVVRHTLHRLMSQS